MATVSFSGMSSGLDTDSIVDAMCATAKNKVTKSQQAEKKIEIKQEVWKEINKKILSFSTTTLDKYRFKTNYSTKVTSASVSGIAKVTGGLTEGSMNLKVDQLATKATLATKKVTYTDAQGMKATAGKSTKLGDIFGAGVADPTTITVSGTDAAGNTYNDEITLTDDMTMEDLTKELSSKLGHCNVSYNESLGTFSIGSKETGVDQTISLEVKDGYSDALSVLGFKTTSAEGTNAVGVLDGMEFDEASNTIGMGTNSSITLTGVGSTTLTTEKDTDGVYDLVSNFVNEYNTLVDEISKLVDAESTKLEPLTDDEKADMSENEIKEHEEKLKAAALRRDSTLSTLRTELREIISTTYVEDANGNKISLSSIGIKTSSDWTKNGKLEIDEEKLKQAIETNPDGIAELFAGRTDGNEGVATKLYNKMSEKLKGTNQKSTNNIYNDKVLTKELKSQKSMTTKFEERLKSLKELYYAKFTAMETMLSSMNSQSSVISSYFGSAS